MTSATKQSEQRRQAWRFHQDLAELKELEDEKTKAQREVARLSARHESLLDEHAIERNRHAEVFHELERHYAALVCRLLDESATGTITFDGNGLQPKVDWGGDRDTPAISTMKLLAFDLAAMCRSIEGETNLPAFLIHDSPREGDLGLSIYNQLFEVARELEGDMPPFQYIVTTTTRPPEEFQKEPYLRVKLHGAPATMRLLAVDL